MDPSMVVLLNTPLILLPMRLIPKVSPRFDVFLQAKKQVVIRRCSTKELCTALVKKKRTGGQMFQRRNSLEHLSTCSRASEEERAANCVKMTGMVSQANKANVTETTANMSTDSHLFQPMVKKQ